MVTPAWAVRPDGIEGRRDFHHVGADDVQPAQLAQHLLGLEGGEAADLGRAGARRIDGIEHVDVEAHIDGAVAHDTARLGHDGLGALFHRLLDAHEAHAHLRAIVEVVEIVHGAAQADLDGAPGIEHAVLDGAAEGRAMGVFEAAEIAVVEIGMGIEMDHAHRLLRAHRAQHRQRAEMIAARRERPDALGDERREVILPRASAHPRRWPD